MHRAIDITALSSDIRERNKLYQTVSSLYHRRFGNSRWDTPFRHAQVVTEEVARYSASSVDKNWSGKCVFLASVHPFGMEMAPHLAKIFPPEECATLMSSFSRFNILREQDEAPPEKKNRDVYLPIITPYQADKRAFIWPEAFVRVVDLSQPQFFKGMGARELHTATSRGSIDEVNRNLAVSMRMVWRSAAISLLLFKCYDAQSDLAAQFLHEGLYRKVRGLLKEVSSEIEEVKDRFEGHMRLLIGLAERRGIPILGQVDRETGRKADFTIRVKTAGSTTLKLVDKFGADPLGNDFDPDFVLANIHDPIGSTLVSKETWDAEALFNLIENADHSILMETESLFHGGVVRAGSLPDYREAGHMDYDASNFGASRMKRLELHIRSFRGYMDYYLSRTCGRGVRESPLIADAWGDLNYSIVEALGTLRAENLSGTGNGH